MTTKSSIVLFRCLLKLQHPFRHLFIQKRHIRIFFRRRLHVQSPHCRCQQFCFLGWNNRVCLQIRFGSTNTQDNRPGRYIAMNLFEPFLAHFKRMARAHIVTQNGCRCILIIHFPQNPKLFLSRSVPNLYLASNALYLKSFGNEKGTHRGTSSGSSKVALGKSQYQRCFASVGVSQHDDLEFGLRKFHMRHRSIRKGNVSERVSLQENGELVVI
mmetsp:Transcript_9647/g.14186  ORF Transcript_9647/g.14186 Transcript_9647/m.14186 type:complete len:214 (+) Transcript_9647:675-1316(+)